MENNQSTQQNSSESSSSKLEQSSRSPAKRVSLNSLIELIKHHPWLMWVGVWALLVVITAIAMFSLAHTGSVEQEEPEKTPVAVENTGETSSQTGSPIPLWLMGAVVLTCATGSVVIYKRLKRSSGLPKLRKRSSARIVTRRQPRKQLLQPPPVPTSIEEPQPPVAVPAEAEAEVTVLPADESHPLDSGSESLAEMMDIRKQQTLSSILRRKR